MEDRSLNDLFASLTLEARLQALMSEMLTPIEIIRGNCAVIKKRVSIMETRELIECVDSIEEAAERLKELRNAIRSGS